MGVQRIREPEISDACRTITIDQYVGLQIDRQFEDQSLKKNPTHAFQICVNGWPVMKVLQSTSDICQL